MKAVQRLVLAAVLAAPVVLAAAPPASLLKTVEPGYWEIQRSGSPLKRTCVAQVAALAQLEHQGMPCTRVVIRDNASAATIHYTCAGGGFGESAISLLTPRSLRIQTQGISDGAPFNYVFQARRIGACPAH